MSAFSHLAAPEASTGSLIDAATEKLRIVFATIAPDAIVTISGQRIRPLHGVLELTPGRDLMALIGRHQIGLFIYENEFHDRRYESFGDTPSCRTVAADITDYSGPAIAAGLPRLTARQQHHADFAAYATECRASFLIGSYEPGQGIIDNPRIRPFAYKLNPEFSAFTSAIVRSAIAATEPAPPRLRKTQFYHPIENLSSRTMLK